MLDSTEEDSTRSGLDSMDVDSALHAGTSRRSSRRPASRTPSVPPPAAPVPVPVAKKSKPTAKKSPPRYTFRVAACTDDGRVPMERGLPDAPIGTIPTFSIRKCSHHAGPHYLSILVSDGTSTTWPKTTPLVHDKDGLVNYMRPSDPEGPLATKWLIVLGTELADYLGLQDSSKARDLIIILLLTWRL